jgi:uncharacterized repeat protein (TIGR01451 family)
MAAAAAFVFISGFAAEPAQARARPKAVSSAPFEFVTLPVTDEQKGVAPTRLPSPAGPQVAYAPSSPLGQGFGGEVEPNGTSATATPLAGNNVVVHANLTPNGDVDFFSFNANAGDRVYAALMTSGSAGSSTDSQLTLLASDGTTTIEFDDDNGTFAALSSSIAGATIPTTGTYFLKVNDFTAGTTSERGYDLHLRVQSGAPTPEVEGNDTPATATPLPANGWVSGARNPAAATEQDWYSLNLNAGDTVYLALDLDPERDGVSWNGRLGFALFGDAGNQILVVDDAGTGDVTPNPNIPSEAMFFTVKDAGTYFAFVDSASAAVGGPTATYHLSVTVHPHVDEGVNCTTYTSTDVPKAIGPGTGLVSSTITIPGNPRIADVDVAINLNHAVMQDVDAHLRSPAGNDIGLFTDIGAAATGGQQVMDVVFDDEAAIPPAFTVFKGTQLKPENNSTAGTANASGAYRLAAFDGENAGGTWTLDLRDDTAGANGGTLNAWSLRVCEAPPPPACPAGFAAQTVYGTDFESGAAGFTHSGAQDEWELGLPATAATTTANPIAAFNTCNSGVNCWKTDLDNTYDASSSQDLLSPPIDLSGLSPPIVVTWAQRHQIETANFDHYFVDAQQVGGATPVRLYEWLDPTPISASGGTGNPQVNIGGSYGWGVISRRADSLAGLNAELRFHLDSDTTVQFAGAAIDDVSVTGCRALSSDLSITKTDGVGTATPGGSVTYTINAGNAGPDAVSGATVADTFPAINTCTWTCVGAGGGTCTASGSGNINDPVDLPVGGSVTYTASCAISASATGTLSNTATVSSAVTDPDPANNSATDTDTLTPNADISITKTDGVTTATPGGSVTYTITASNAGPSNAPGSTVADTFPASETCTWTCVGAGGGTCTAAGSGNINDVTNLPAGGSVTYTASCAVSAAATGTLGNTATAAAPPGVTDPNPTNNSATDTDTLTPNADISITKTDGVTTATPGGSVTYTITASNAGPSNANGATVADTFPASETCTWTCVGAGGGTCTASGSGNVNDVTNLPAGGSVTYTASCTVSAAASGTLANTATVTAPAGTTDPNPADNSATDTDALVATADVSITKTDGVTSATAGGNVTYTITASNAGPSNAPGSTVADTFPASETCTWTCVGAGGGTCTAAGSGNIADTTNLPAGGSVTYTASCAISASATGSLVNTATVTAGSATDPNPGNNSATDTDALGASADLSITKTDGVTSVTAGGSVTYTITASNAGPSNASGATVADTFPADETCTWTCVGAGGGTCTAAGSGNIADTTNLPVGGSVTYTASCAVSASASGSLGNTATIAAPAGTTDTNPANNSATDVDTVNPAGADVGATKVVSGVFAPGTTVTYAVVLTNGGGAQGDNPGDEFTDVLPAGLALVSATATGGTAVATVGTNTVTWNGAIPAGGSVTITITATIDASASGTISNQGTVAYDSDANGTNDAARPTDDPSLGGASDPTSFVVGGSIADLSITKTDGVTGVTAGGSTTYTIVAANAGPSDAIGASVTDTFPLGETCTWTCAGAGGGACAASGSGDIADTVDVPAGGSVTYTATCAIAASASGTLVNTASIAAPAGATDPNPADNSATDVDSVTLVPGAAVAATKTVAAGSGGFTPGSTVTYTIVLTNSGAGAQGDNPGSEFTDTLPAGVGYVAATASSGTVGFGPGTLVHWDGAIPAGGSVTITITATVVATSGTVVNQGFVSYDGDGDGSNESSAPTDDPAGAGAADPTAFAVAAAPGETMPVPALDRFAMLLLIGALFTLAWRSRRQTRG